MAEPVPFALAAPRKSTVRTQIVYARDTYNFSSVSVSSAPNPHVPIPASGPNAAGAVPPQAARSVERIDVIEVKPGAPVPGSNFHAPSTCR